MSAGLLFSFVLGYFFLLLTVAYYTSRHSNNDSFFIGNRNSNWMLVAFGMIGTSLSGVTFVSVPGTVGDFNGTSFKAFGYFQVVIGYWIGYFAVAFILLPLYYRLQLTSIYNYLQSRFGQTAYKTGALFFIISRSIGATARLYLVINVLQVFILDQIGVPFVLTVSVILLMILLYTLEGGVKTIVYTDTLQTSFMLIGLIVCIFYIMQRLGLNLGSSIKTLGDHGYLHFLNTDVKSKGFFLKQIVGGMFITIGMTGLDQEMMQKNISVRNLKDSQKNMLTFCMTLLVVNFLFLLLGGLLYLYALNNQGSYLGHSLIFNGHNIIGDDLFPMIALNAMPRAVGVIFIIGLISALFPSADGALTALTSSFCIDILGLNRRKNLGEKKRRKLRMTVHICMAVLFFMLILFFKDLNSKSIINNILDLAGYTYGPLLGLFSFGVFTRRKLPDNWSITAICLFTPALCYVLSHQSSEWFGGYQIGYELLLINGVLTFSGLWAISDKNTDMSASL
jgi:Na+/proline symporter